MPDHIFTAIVIMVISDEGFFMMTILLTPIMFLIHWFLQVHRSVDNRNIPEGYHYVRLHSDTIPAANCNDIFFHDKDTDLNKHKGADDQDGVGKANLSLLLMSTMQEDGADGMIDDNNDVKIITIGRQC